MMKTTERRKRVNLLFIVLSSLTILLFGRPEALLAASAEEINIGVDGTLQRFRQEITGGAEFLRKADGVLVFPKVLKAGFGVGGEYGEGALRVGGKTVAYYNTAGASIGLQLGAQSESVVIVFLTRKALDDFRKSQGWEAGVDGSIAVIKWGVGEDINTIEIKDPIVAFVFDNKGLMYNLSLKGAKFSQIRR